MKNKRRIVSMLIAGIFAITPMIHCNSYATYNPNKDPNGDGVINVADYVYIVQYLNGSLPDITDLNPEQLDLNDNGVVSITDAQMVLVYDSGGVLS